MLNTILKRIQKMSSRISPWLIIGLLVKRLSVSVLDIGISSEIENKFKNIELVFKHYFDTEFNIQ